MNRTEKMKWIDELKRNRCGFFTINDQARGMIEKYWSAIEVRHKGSWQKPWFPFSKIDDGCVCRLRPDFELPEEPEGRWVESAITDWAGQYYCMIIPPVWFEIDNIPIHQLPSVVGFGGVQFNGGHPHEWTFQINQTISGYHSTNDPKQKPAIPIKARFWVES